MQNLPIFADQGSSIVGRLMSGTQAVIPDYSFDCYGNVTQWGAFVERAGVRYSLDFQVWRRSGGGQGTTGEYDFVGSNYFPSIDPPGGGRIDGPVPVEDQIKVRPGDVIGLYITTSTNNGVELKQQDNARIWFATSLPGALSTRIRVGSTSGYELTSTTTAIPVITAVVVPSTPSPSPTLLPSPTPLSSSSGLLPESVLATSSVHVLQPPPLTITQTGTSQTTQTLQTQVSVQFSAPSIPQPSSFLPSPNTTTNPVGPGLLVGVTVAIVLIVVVLGVLILVFMLALAWRRMAKKPPSNPERLGN